MQWALVAGTGEGRRVLANYTFSLRGKAHFPVLSGSAVIGASVISAEGEVEPDSHCRCGNSRGWITALPRGKF